jgi:hypothetical protein
MIFFIVKNNSIPTKLEGPPGREKKRWYILVEFVFHSYIFVETPRWAGAGAPPPGPAARPGTLAIAAADARPPPPTRFGRAFGLFMI